MKPAVLLLALLPAALGAQAYAFTNVNVVPMDEERVLTDHTVVVRDGMIVAVGPSASTAVPADAVQIAGRNRWLMPGLAEMHAHVPGGQNPAFTENMLFLYVASGVTTIRGMLGAPSHLALRDALERGTVLGPRLWTSGPSVNGNSVGTPDSARRTPAWQQAQGYDFIKIHPGLSRAVFDSLDAAADRVGMRYAGHVPADVGVRRAIEAGYWSIDHLDGYLEAAAGVHADQAGFFGAAVADRVRPGTLRELVQLTADAGVWNVPTQTLMESYASDATPEELAALRPEIRYMPPQVRQGWLNWKGSNTPAPAEAARTAQYLTWRRQLIRDLYHQTGRVLLGSDAPQVWNVPGFSAIRELETYVAAGLSPYEALTTGTTAVARYFGVSDRAGTVASGHRADLLLLEANPLEDVSHLRRRAGVMLRGRWLPAEELDARLAAIAAEYAN